ncbi:trimeric intracellular cation channel family protein [Halobacillus campisalis]|uniref:Trimeric intracellular cation channel family protein n=1 Tax=Halobacillus campisalis TaxID=435909 RepID=A0ABW2K009_9BACI|nr:trimeric intracellular cation channel family protein [Halobacillus campisalis]
MSFELLNVIAVSAFAFSGAIVALSERYDIFGTFILGIATAFAGGIIRNIALDVPVVHVWDQGYLFYVAIITISVVYVFPKNWVMFWDRWNIYLDAIGLSAFALQGAAFAIDNGFSLGGIIFSAILTGVGGGVTRDVLAQRRPMVLHQEIYAVWAMAAGLIVGAGLVSVDSVVQTYILFLLIIMCRVLSYHLGWHLRFRDLYRI